MKAKIEEKIVNFALKMLNGMKWGWVSILLVIMVSCGPDEVPEQFLSEEELAQVLLDIYVAEGMLPFKNSPIPSDEIYDVYRDVILERHGISDSLFHVNMSYYVTNPEHLDRVYEIVIDSLKLREQAMPERPN